MFDFSIVTQWVHSLLTSFMPEELAVLIECIVIGVCIMLAYAVIAIIMIFKPFHNDSLIKTLFDIAGYTYGPLLGLFCFGLFIKNRQPNDKFVPFIAILSPVLSYIINIYSEELLFGYKFGFEILILNGLLTFIGLLLCNKKTTPETIQQ